jgi:hypothetical protein
MMHDSSQLKRGRSINAKDREGVRNTQSIKKGGKWITLIEDNFNVG